MKAGLVSIITPAYNCEKYIAEAIESVIGQTYKNWEMIITNDCSTDRTAKIVGEYAKQDSRIKLLNLKVNSGVAVARNISIKNAKGQYIAFLDSDDYWLEQKLEKQLHFMKSSNCGFSFTGYRQVVNKLVEPRTIAPPSILNYKAALKGNPIGCLTVILDKSLVGDFHMEAVKHEDYALWLKILKNNIGYGLKDDLARYRKAEASISANKKQSAIWTWNIYRNVEKLSIVRSSWYLVHYIFKGLFKHYFKY